MVDERRSEGRKRERIGGGTAKEGGRETVKGEKGERPKIREGNGVRYENIR